jgi:hypothetical protein
LSSSIIDLLLTYGPLGIWVVLMLLGVLVPRWPWVTQLEQENELLRTSRDHEREAAREAISQLATANQLIGELRQLALQRASLPPPLSNHSLGTAPEVLDGRSHVEADTK